MIWTIIGAILIFSVIIFVHELGHFVAAKAFGVNVLEFAIGMGPAIWKKQGKNTLYSIRAIPMGGFCKMEGEDEDTGTDGAFSRKKPLPKIVILIAGAAMNILLGFIIVVTVTGVSAARNGGIASTVVESVNPEAQAAQFLQPGDKIVKVNDTTVHIKRDISFELSNAGGGESIVEFIRDGQRYRESFTPMQIKYDDGSVGYVIGFNVAAEKPGILNVLHESVFQTVWMVKLVFVSLGMLLGGKASVSDMSGPVGVVSAMNTAAQSGWLNFLFFAAFLTVNIGVMNLLPLPALDGGRTVFALIELIFRKPVPVEKEGIVHFVGFVLLIALMVFVTWNDIVRLIA
ncbi:MAG: RIP metalloprotease RseP [Clostridia bacterium]|nr:RIP metalloprotease RseP [Clostridia bacterium]